MDPGPKSAGHKEKSDCRNLGQRARHNPPAGTKDPGPERKNPQALRQPEGGPCIASEAQTSLREEDSVLPGPDEQVHGNSDVETGCEAYYLDQREHGASRESLSRLGNGTHPIEEIE